MKAGNAPDVSRSAWIRPLILDLGCCGVSAIQIGAAGYRLPGFAGRAYDLEPHEANVLVVAGRVSRSFVPRLRSLYEQLASPGWVIAYGVCAISGVLFDTIPVDRVIPVDWIVPGCPPLTQGLQDALAHLPRQRPS